MRRGGTRPGTLQPARPPGAGLAQLDYSLDYIQQIGVQNIQRHRQPLLDTARVELERRGYRCLTPVGASSPILTFVYPDAWKLGARLEGAKVEIAPDRQSPADFAFCV